MKEFIDDVTPLNRANLMAAQGFQNATIEFLGNGNIIETYEDGTEYITTFNADGSITRRLMGDYPIAKTTHFNDDGTITEVLS